MEYKACDNYIPESDPILPFYLKNYSSFEGETEHYCILFSLIFQTFCAQARYWYKIKNEPCMNSVDCKFHFKNIFFFVIFIMLLLHSGNKEGALLWII